MVYYSHTELQSHTALERTSWNSAYSLILSVVDTQITKKGWTEGLFFPLGSQQDVRVAVSFRVSDLQTPVWS